MTDDRYLGDIDDADDGRVPPQHVDQGDGHDDEYVEASDEHVEVLVFAVRLVFSQHVACNETRVPRTARACEWHASVPLVEPMLSS